MTPLKAMRVNFEEVSIKATRRWTDENGKKRQQTRKFFQTLNPFNTGADDLPKSRDQIISELQAEKAVWLAGGAK